MLRRNLLAGFAGLGAAAITAPAAAAAAAMPRVQADKMPALMGGDFATATSQLALSRSRNRAVRTFAELEIEEQAAVAKAFGATPGRAGIRRDQAAMYEQLRTLDGARFDLMYVDGQIKGHRELLRIHQRYAASGSDPMARGASIVGVPSIKSHLAMLQALRGVIA